MRLLVQRVKSASVTVHGAETGKIGKGLLVFIGVGSDDTEQEVRTLSEKCLALRIFEDSAGKMNLSVQEVRGSVLVVPQFTLYANLEKGNRPNFMAAAPPLLAEALYGMFCNAIRDELGSVQTGIFGAHMDVELVNDGPVTLWIER